MRGGLIRLLLSRLVFPMGDSAPDLQADHATGGNRQRYAVFAQSHAVQRLLLYGAAGHIAVHVGFAAQLLTKLKIFMGAVAVILDHPAPDVDGFYGTPSGRYRPANDTSPQSIRPASGSPDPGFP